MTGTILTLKTPGNLEKVVCLKAFGCASAASLVALQMLLCLLASGVSQETLAPTVALSDSEKLVNQLVKESKIHDKQRPLNPNDVLDLAQLKATGLADDITELGKSLRLIMLAYAREKRWEDADSVLMKIPGWHVAAGAAELALEEANIGRLEQAKAHLEISKKNILSCTGTNKDKVYLIQARVLYVLGDTKAVELLTQQMAPDVKIKLLVATEQIEEGPFPNVDFIKQTRQSMKLPARLTSEWALMLAKQLSVRKQIPEVQALVDYAGQITAPPASFADQRGLIEVARVAKLLGESKTALKALNLYLASMSQLDQSIESRTEILVEGAILLHDWDRKEDAEKLLRKADEGASKVFIYEAVSAHLAMARGWKHVAYQEASAKAVLNAAKLIPVMKHPRPRALAAVQICLFHAEQGLPLAEEISSLLSPTTGED